MTIAFLTGSAQPGRDGVGDYTRRLAAELLSRDHVVRVIATHDREVNSITEEIQAEAGRKIPVLRLPFATTASQRARIIQDALRELDATWVSWQFVPFSFDAKGMPYVFLRDLTKILAPYRTHVMFHELWQGMETTASVKSRAAALVQRTLIRYLLRAARPEAVATQATPYRDLLLRMVPDVDLLPLISNIPVSSLRSRNQPVLRFVFFAAIYPLHCIPRFVAQIDNWIDDTRQKVEFHFVGRNGNEADNVIEEIERAKNAPVMRVVRHGEVAASVVSSVLMGANIGLTTFPYTLIEKSGSVAAYRAHGLPTLCLSRGWTSRRAVSEPVVPGIESFDPNGLDKQLTRLRKANVSTYSVAELADDFVASLNKADRG